MTCGQGLAAHAPLPAALSELMTAMADVLDTHQQALDINDDTNEPELQAYRRLVRDFRAIAAGLAATAERMTGCRDLPTGRHHETMMSSPAATSAFDRYVRAERALLSLLTTTIADHEAMLDQMRT